MSRAREVSAHQAPDLHAMVTDLSARGGISRPRVYLIPDAQPNAFATGGEQNESQRQPLQGRP